MNHSYRASALAKGLKILQAGLLMLSLFSMSAGSLLAFPMNVSAATIVNDGFGTGSDDYDIDNWNEEGSDSDSSTLSKQSGSGEDTTSPNGGRFAKIGHEEWICRQVSAAGLENLTLKYYWKGDNDAENNSDYGIVEYRATSNGDTDQTCNSNESSWTELESHELDNDPAGGEAWSALQTINLPSELDNDSSFFIRYRNDAQESWKAKPWETKDDTDSEYFRIDGVLLEGDTLNPAPTATIDQAGGQSDPTHSSPINFKVTFNENVTGFNAADIEITGTAGADTAVVTGGPAVYNVAVSGMENPGSVYINFESNSAEDGGGKGNTAPTIIDNFVTFANQAPVAENQDVETDQDQSKTITLGASDGDGDSLTWEIVNDPTDGVLSNLLFPNVTYTPDSGFFGDDFFQFRVFDGFEWSNAARVDIEVDQADCPKDQHRNEAGNCVPNEPPQEAGQCTIVSNTEDFYVEGEANAVVTWKHPAWTTIADASWIWGQTEVTKPRDGETQNFTKTFSITDVPSSAMLELAVDNGARVVINDTEVHDSLDGLDGTDQNYNGSIPAIDVAAYLVAGENTIEIEVVNLPYDTDDAHTNPAGLIYKLVMEDVDCGEPVDTVTIVASKIVCTDESQLPNWGTGSAEGLERPITAQTAENWVANHNTCSLKSGWEFQVGDQNAGDPGRGFLGAFDGYTTFGPTNAQGVATAEFPLEEGVTELHLREVLKLGFIPFTFDQQNQSNENNVSAEFYCSNDVLNYDNWDFIRNPVAGETYHCVAWNVPDGTDVCEPEAVQVLLSSDDEDGDLLTTVGGNPAEIVGEFIHDSWVDAIDALWIWKEAGTNESDAANGITETFVRTFDIEGTPTGATLDIAADNSVVVKVNGDEFLTLSGEFNYGATSTHAIPAAMLQGGENEIEFIVTNMNHETENTPETNPAGLLYKLTVNNNECEPYVPEEEFASVTMCKVTGDGEAWEYLPEWQLMLLGDAVGSINVLPDGNDHTIANVPAGDYVVQADGSYVYRPNDAAASTSDAAFSLRLPSDGYTGSYAPWIEVNTFPDPYTGWLGVMLNSGLTDWGSVFNPDHAYALGMTTNAAQDFDFKILDDQYGDNSGSINVTVNEGFHGITGENGCVTFTEVPFGSYTIAEIGQEGWSFEALYDEANQPITGLTVVVDETEETFTVMNTEGEGNGGGETDVCPNLTGPQASVPDGYVLEEGQCVLDNGGEVGGAQLIVVSPSDMKDWYEVITVGGDVEFVTVAGAPLGVGALNLTTEADNQDRAALVKDENVPLADITTLEYRTKRGAGFQVEGNAAYRLRIDADGDVSTTGDVGTLVFEPYWQNGGVGDAAPVVEDVWQTWNVFDGIFWASIPGGNSIPGMTNGAGGPPFYTIDDVLALHPDALVLNQSVGIGSYNNNYDVLVDAVVFGTSAIVYTYDFEPEVTEQPSAPKDKKSSSGQRVQSVSSGGGEVLGATTECSALINEYMGRGYPNTASEVMKLQGFLNTEVGSALPLTGVFGPMTEAAVHVFQKKYWEDVLKPWFEFPEVGIADADDSTGIVYKTTKWKINDIFCPGSEALPALP